MSQRLSKILLALEATFVMLPITFLFLLVAVEMLAASLQFEVAWQLRLIALVIIAAALAAGWSLMAAFWRRGSEGLRSSPLVLWFSVLVGASATLISAALVSSGATSQWPSGATQPLWALAWGIPLLLPLGHLLAERQLRSAANTSLERTRER